ncbi:MAG TPA: BrnT family toxin [Candidatus Kapabacteria bacterium]|jgi:hypothetical protein|nr:BrnT family toxin [Candidatus Kapabacteria bacterium]
MGYLEDHHLEGFEWDEGNSYKSWLKHGVSNSEAEQVFSNKPFYFYGDNIHSSNEERKIIMGKTDTGRAVLISFTHRGQKVRVISSRWMGRRDRKRFNEAIKGDTKL